MKGQKHFEQKHREHISKSDAISEFIKRLKKEGIGKIDVKDLVKPKDGYAYRIIEALSNRSKQKNKRSQLRKIYAEFKAVIQSAKNKPSDKKYTLDNDEVNRLYMLYPVLSYQAERGLIDKDFAELMEALIDNITQNQNDRATVENAERFLIALVGYMPKEG